MHTQDAGKLKEYHLDGWELMLKNKGKGEIEIKMEKKIKRSSKGVKNGTKSGRMNKGPFYWYNQSGNNNVWVNKKTSFYVISILIKRLLYLRSQREWSLWVLARSACWGMAQKLL